MPKEKHMQLDRNDKKIKHSINEDQFQIMFDGMNIGATLCELITDKQGNPKDYRFLKINPAFEKQSGMNVSYSLGKTIKEVFPDIQQSWIDKLGSVVVSNEPIEFINHSTNKSYNVNVFSFSENKFAMFFEDITQRKKAEEKLIKSEQQYKQLFNSMTEMIVVIEMIYNNDSQPIDWYIRQINKPFAIFLGKTQEELLNKKVTSVINTVEDSWLQAFSEVEKTGKSIKFENYGAEYDKTYQVGAWKMTKNTVGVSFTDITDIKQAEKVSIESHRLSAIGEMASSIAHDFNNSLQLMMGNLEIIRIQSDLSVTVQEHIDNIGLLIEDVASRTKSMQNFGDKNNYNTEFESLDLNKITTESIKQSRPLWKDEMEKIGLKMNINTDFGKIPNIIFNKGALSSIIYNLIKNSIEAMPEGGEITIKTGIKTEGIFLTCMDSGIGMNQETKLKIFQPFYTTKGYKTGRGLGMSGVYSVIKEAGGSVRVKNTIIGKGTTIEIVLPANKLEEMKIIEEVVSIKRSLRILYVEDEAIIAMNSKKIIEDLGHECDIELSGEQALISLEKEEYDVVITDIGMPGMSGWQFATAVKNKFGDAIKIIIASGWNIKEEELKQHRINYCLTKPYTKEDIKKVFSKIQ